MFGEMLYNFAVTIAIFGGWLYLVDQVIRPVINKILKVPNDDQDRK